MKVPVDDRPAETGASSSCFFCLSRSLRLRVNVAAIAFGASRLSQALMVSRAMIFPPNAAWIGSGRGAAG